MSSLINYSLPVIISTFANHKEQAYLSQLEEEQSHLLTIFAAIPEFRHVSLSPAKRDQLLEMLEQYRMEAQIFHFGGHAAENTLYFSDGQGDGQSLARILGQYPNLRIAFLNGCDTQNQVREYLESGVPAVIVSTCPINDKHASRFAEAFYTGLSKDNTIEQAFYFACKTVKFGMDSEDGKIVIHRGLDKKGQNIAEMPWCLHLREDRATELKNWKLTDSKHKFLNAITPQGVVALEKYFSITTETKSYRKFFSSENLPYYSLDLFHQMNASEPGIYSETYIVKELLEAEQFAGGIISGKGGIGKTRLMLEIGLLAQEKGWKVWVLNEHFQDIKGLGNLLSTIGPSKNLLLIDYIEERTWFDDSFLENLSEHYEGDVTVKFLTNCRNSYSYNEYSHYLDIKLDNHDSQSKYEKWVIQQILSGLSDHTKLAESKVKKASFAVFLYYLQDRNSADQKLSNFKDFRSWLCDRFMRSLDNTRKKNIRLFGREIRWLLCLPLKKEDLYSADKTYRDTLDQLWQDGWLEETEDSSGELINLRIVQDTVMDELVLAYLNTFKGVNVEFELSDSFQYAYEQKKAKNWLIALQRIKDDPLLKKNEDFFFNVLNKKLQNSPPEEEWLAEEIERSQLLSIVQLFNLVDKFSHFFGDSVLNKSLLGYSMQGLFKQKTEPPLILQEKVHQFISKMDLKNKNAIINQLTAKFIASYLQLFGFTGIIEPLLNSFLYKINSHASFVLPIYLEKREIIPNKINDYMTKYISTYSNLAATSYVIRAWLKRNNNNSSSIIPGVKRFLKQNTTNREVYFVLLAWIEAGGVLDVIKKGVGQYLKENFHIKDSSFLIQSWLDGGGGAICIEDAVHKYLETYSTEVEIQFIIKSWLSVGGSKEAIRDSLITHLNENCEEKHLQFIIKTWLDAGGDKTIIEFPMKKYLAKNIADKECSFAIAAWLNAGGEKEFIQNELILYLNKNAQEKEAGFVFKAWLDAGGNKESIQSELIKYLDKNAQEKEASFAIAAWLDAGGGKEFIQSELIKYLDKNAQEKEASFAIAAWLYAKGSRTIIKKALILCLNKNTQDKEAGFVFKAWLDAGGDKEFIQSELIKYLDKNAQEKEASFAIAAWLDAEGDKTVVQKVLIRYFNKNAQEKEACFVFKAWLDAEGSKTIIQKALTKYLNKNAQEKEASLAIAAWLDAGGDKKIIRDELITYLNKNAHEKEVHFVIKAWLDAGGDKKIIRGELITYLNKNAHEKEASFAITAWLKANGDKNIILNELITYLNKNVQEKEASFAIAAWLDAKGDKKIILNYLITYLKKNAQEKEAQFVFKAWLEAEGDKKIIQNYLITYLNKNIQEKEASFTLASWLNAKGDKKIIQNHLIPYLNKNSQEYEASFIFKAWLEAGGDKALVQEAIMQYLNKNAQKYEASFVLEPWITAGGQKEVISSYLESYLLQYAQSKNAAYLLRWIIGTEYEEQYTATVLNEHLKTQEIHKETGFIYVAWVKNKRPLVPIKNFLQTYLSQHADFDRLHEFYCEAIQIEEYRILAIKWIPKWLKANLEKVEAIDVFISWAELEGELNLNLLLFQAFLDHHIQNPKIITWIKDWMEKSLNPGQAQVYALQYLDLQEAYAVLACWLVLGNNTQIIQEAVLAHFDTSPSDPNMILLYLAWIGNHNEWECINPYLKLYFEKNADYFPTHIFYSLALKRRNHHPIVFEWINIWLTKHFMTNEALDLVHTWLMSAKAPMPDCLLLTILKEHIHSPKLEVIFQKWLELGFELRVIQIHLIKWLKLFANDRRVDNIYHLLIARNELLPYFEQSYKRWVQLEHKLGV